MNVFEDVMAIFFRWCYSNGSRPLVLEVSHSRSLSLSKPHVLKTSRSWIILFSKSLVLEASRSRSLLLGNLVSLFAWESTVLALHVCSFTAAEEDAINETNESRIRCAWYWSQRPWVSIFPSLQRENRPTRNCVAFLRNGLLPRKGFQIFFK